MRLIRLLDSPDVSISSDSPSIMPSHHFRRACLAIGSKKKARCDWGSNPGCSEKTTRDIKTESTNHYTISPILQGFLFL